MSSARRAAAVLAAALLTAGSGAIALVGSARSAAAATASGAVTLTVTAVSPQTPDRSFKPEKLSIAYVLQNNTAEAITGVTISADRSNPITTQQALDHAMAHPTTPDPASLQHITATHPNLMTNITVPAAGTFPGTFDTTSDIPQDAGLCLCADAIYPIYLTATITTASGTQVLASTQTYLPAYGLTNPTPIQVGWLWPLLDRPHRLTSPTLFLDDDLATEVASGGRLYRALTVLENVASQVPMTIVTDPNLIDELQVMAEGPYQVSTGTNASTPGTGTADAAAWLARLRAVLDQNPGVEIDFTPYGDPDVATLQSNGLGWRTNLNAATQARITAALGSHVPDTNVAWPAGGSVSQSTLTALSKTGINTVVLDDHAVPAGTTDNPRPTALATLKTGAGAITAAVTSRTIDSWAAQVLSASGAGAAAIPQLVAQVALRSEESLQSSRYVLIAPPRDVDTDPDVATSAILETSTRFWATPLALGQAVSNAAQLRSASLKPQKVPAIPETAISDLRYVVESIPGLTDLFTTPADRTTELGTLGVATRLASSSSLISQPTVAESLAHQLATQVRTLLTTDVTLIAPATKNYTFTSSSSSVPVSISNKLPVEVSVEIQMSTVGGLPGFRSNPVQVRIEPRSNVQIPVHAQLDRTGRIDVDVTISTPGGLQLGAPVRLSLRSTALGTIGVVITTVAAVVLVIALLVRVIRRLRTPNGRRPATASALDETVSP